MKVFFDTTGCRLNQAEVEQYAAQFSAFGYEVTANAGEADVTVINTCSVTAAAASDSRGKIRSAARLGCKNIIVTGCWSEMEPDYAAEMVGVARVVRNYDKDRLVMDYLGIDQERFDSEPLHRITLPGVHARTRAFIKVQDGCDNHCTFCVTRLARGKARSCPTDLILREAASSAVADVKEIVLTGVNLGAWGLDFPEQRSLSDLITFLLQETAFPRIRLSSLESWNLSESFIRLWSDERLCPHLHLPLQSGSPAVLRRMGRRTTPGEFSDLVSAARSLDPDFAITTDVIVGFPGETDGEFEDTLDFIQKMNFAGGHVFSFSARPGTAAARMEERVDMKIAGQRSEILRKEFAQSRMQFYSRFVGKPLEVLWESAVELPDGGWKLHGLTKNYLSVSALSARPRHNSIDVVIPTDLDEKSLVCGKVDL